jgi:hypothetical protein
MAGKTHAVRHSCQSKPSAGKLEQSDVRCAVLFFTQAGWLQVCNLLGCNRRHIATTAAIDLAMCMAP